MTNSTFQCACGDHCFRMIAPQHVVLVTATDQDALAGTEIQTARLQSKAAIAKNGGLQLAAQIYDPTPMPDDLAAKLEATGLQRALRRPLRTVLFGDKAAVAEFINGNPLDLRRCNVALRAKQQPRDYRPGLAVTAAAAPLSTKLNPIGVLQAKRERSRNRPSKLHAKAEWEAKKASNKALHALSRQPEVVMAFLLDRRNCRRMMGKA